MKKTSYYDINLDVIPSPSYVLVERDLVQNLELLKYIQDIAGVSIICALKGFSMWSTFELVNKYLKGATASSLNEAKLINDEMKVKAHTYCPVYVPDEFEDIVSLSSHITFNSITELERYIPEVKLVSKGVDCGIRINPEYSEIKTDLYNPARKLSRLGVTRDQLGDRLPKGINGLHFHLLCENDSFVLERVLQKAEEKFGDLFSQCKWINLGGGHLITEKNYNINHLVEVLKGFKSRYPKAEIILEPGEAVGWETGFLLSTVLDIIEKDELRIAMLDVSFAAHMPDALEMPYKPNVLGTIQTKKSKKPYVFGGNTCLAGDFMGDYYFENDLKVGDKIVFLDMIHYTMVKTNFFNGVKHPSIGKININNNFQMLREFSFNNYRNKLS